MGRKIALLEMTLQPEMVITDENGVPEKIVHPPVKIPAKDWPQYSGTTFPREIRAWQREIDKEDAAKPKPNRQARRAKAKPAARKPKPQK